MDSRIKQRYCQWSMDTAHLLAPGRQPVVVKIELTGLLAGQAGDWHITGTIAVQISKTIFFAISGIGDAELGVPALVSGMIDLAPFGHHQP
jgi:hypothetical protein